MKKWAKVLIIIGIIWVMAILIFNVTLYFKVKQLGDKQLLDEQDVIAMGNWRGFIETIDLSAPFVSFFSYFLLLGIPAWILFIIAGIWGRERKQIIK